MNFLIILLISLFLAHLFGEIFSYFNLPKILGQLITGFILGFPIVKELLFDQATLDIFSSLSNLGIIFLHKKQEHR